MFNWKETKCGKCKIQRGRPVCNSCFSYDKFIPIAITNADRIRSMSDEELAEFLEKILSGNRDEIGINCGNSKCKEWKCTECISKWLQSEVDE